MYCCLFRRLSVFLAVFTFLMCLGAADAVSQTEITKPSQIDEGLQLTEADLALIMEKAEAGDPEAQADLGFAYMLGNGIEMDHDLARLWLETAAKSGEAVALNALATFYDLAGNEEDRSKVFALRLEAADKGDEGAQVNVGVSYYYGSDGVDQDYEKAGEYFLEAANNINPIALYYMGLMSYYGYGVPVDKELSVDLIESSAELGYWSAEFEMGRFYEAGVDVEQDDEKAFEWYLKAAEHGHSLAQWNVGMAYVIGDIVEKDPVTAAEWFQKSADQDNTNGLTSLAVMYATGDGLEQDYETAFNLYLRAAQLGEGHGAKGIGVMYLLGQYVEKDEYTAAIWFRVGGFLGSADSQQVFDDYFSQNPEDVLDEIDRIAFQWILENSQ